MTGAIDLGGVYVHPLMIAALLAFPLAALTERLLARAGFYHFVWHRGLFDIAMTILLWAAIADLLSGGSIAALAS